MCHNSVYLSQPKEQNLHDETFNGTLNTSTPRDSVVAVSLLSLLILTLATALTS